MSKEFIAFGGNKVIASKSIDLEVCYNDKRLLETFWVVDKATEILLSNAMVKSLRGKKEIPIVCKIDTGGKGPISWTRPIKSYKDRQDFEALCNTLKEKNIIEPSISTWLNPVVLIRKKTGI
jgi:hypothetical protein